MYKNNSAIEDWMKLSDDKGEIQTMLDDIEFHDEFYNWLEGFCVQEMHKHEWYKGLKLPEYR